MPDERLPPETRTADSAAVADSIPPAAVATEPVPSARPIPRRRGSAGLRWSIAALITVAVVVVSAAGFMLLSAGAATSVLVGYVPLGSVAYLEIRLDAPGDQRQNAANLLSHFPGFADQSTLNTKMDEALDQLVGGVTDHRQTFSGNIKSWLGDSIAVVLPAAPAMTPGTTSGAKSVLVLVSAKDPAGAQAWAEFTFGRGTAGETYAGVPLTTGDVSGTPVAYGVVSNVLLLGDAPSVHKAIDTGGAAGFGETADFKAAVAATPGDRLAFGYVDVRRIADATRALQPAASAGPMLNPDQLPAWLAITVRAESDSVAATVALPITNPATTASNHASVLAANLPPTTVAAGELHDLGALLRSIAAMVPGAPGTPAGQSQIDQALQALGGIDGLVGWIGDACVAVIRTDGPPGVAPGILIRAPDANTASIKVAQVKNLVALLGAAAGVTVSEETYNGATITLLDAGDLSQLGSTLTQPGVAAFSGIELKIALAQKGDLVAVGLGDAFVKSIFDTRPGASLADQEVYRTAFADAGASNTGQLYVDLGAVLQLAAAQMAPDARAPFEANTEPYLAPLRALAASGSAGDPTRARIVVTVK